MLSLLSLLITAGVAIFGFVQARNFVRGKLRYVDGIHKTGAALIAGAAAAVVATPVAWLLPLIGTGTVLSFGAAVAAGVATGAKDVRRRLGAG